MPKTVSLTDGNTKKQILMFAMPTLLCNVFYQFYNIADTAIAGHILGDGALVAIGATSSIFGLVISFANGVSVGFGIVFSFLFGAEETDKLKKAIAHSLVIDLLLSVIICALSLVFTKPVLKLMNTPENEMQQAYSYIIIILTAVGVSIFFNLEFVILRSLGNSKTPLYFLIFSTLLNVALDYIFLKYLHYGVAGAAGATVISQGVSAVMCFIEIKNNFYIIKLTKSDFKFDKSLFSRLMSTGMTMGSMNSIFQIGSIIMQSSINALGDTVIAAHLASRKLSEIFMQPMITLGSACSVFISQNYGAGKYGRIKEAIKYSALYALAWSVLSFAVLFFFGGKLSVLLTGTANRDISSNTGMYLKINVPFYFVLGLLYILRSSIQSIDRRVPPLVSSGMELVTKILAAFIFIPLWGYFGACIAEPISWCFGTFYLVFAFINSMKKINLGAKADRETVN